jgi:hypothetical protein
MGRRVFYTSRRLSEKIGMASVADSGGEKDLRLALSKAEAAAALGVSVDISRIT